MARTNIPITSAVPNGNVLYPAGTAIDVTNGMNVAPTFTTVPKNPGLDDLLLIVANTAGAPKNVIVRAGVGGGATPGPAFRSGIGDLTVSVTNSTTQIIGPLDSSRFTQTDGSLNLDFGSGMTGTVIALMKGGRF